jgi:predicted Zn-dependent protease
VRDWRNPYGQHGEVRGIVANNKDSTDATVSQTTKIDGQSAAVYNIEGFGSGLNGMRVTLRSHDNGGDDTYTSIDTALFAPFGIVGSPQIDLDAINDDVKTLRVYDVKAKAHTDGSYSLTSDKEYLTSGKPFLNWPSNISGELTLPSYVASLVADKHVASNTSMVVRKRDPIQKLTASGNSMTVRVNRKHQTTASSTSLVVRINRKHQTTASSTSLVVRTRTTTHNTASSTSLVVRISKAIAKVSTDANGGNPTVKPLSDNQLKRVTPVVTKNADGTSTVKMSVYVDPTLTDTANAALADWKTALAAQGVNLEADITSSTTDLKNGVSLVILDANNSDDQVGASADRPYTMNGLGGLTTDTVNSVLTDPSVKFNASGTVTAGDALKNSMTAIQINSEALSGQSFKNAMLDGQLTKEVLKHELGHFLGLHHNTNDSLMTPTISNVVFDGKISDADAKQAAANLIAGLGRHTIANG